jgi:hypothetical protein
MIVELASKGSKTEVDACPLDGNIHSLTEVPLEGPIR